jgi:hypothetical protein
MAERQVRWSNPRHVRDLQRALGGKWIHLVRNHAATAAQQRGKSGSKSGCGRRMDAGKISQRAWRPNRAGRAEATNSRALFRLFVCSV